MLRLFSSIRKTLINEGKTFRYVRYAVGEFLLIVAGILVALQIQNWNEGRKLEQERRELIESLKVDVAENLNELDEVLQDGEEKIESIRRFLELSIGDSSEVQVDEMKEMARFGGSAFRFSLNLPSYEAAVSTGKLGLIETADLTGHFIRLNYHNHQLQRLVDYTSETMLVGSRLDLFKQVGSRSALGRYGINVPNAEPFSLTDQEYREFIARKEVYAIYENIFSLQSSKLRELGALKDITNEILTALESLE